LPHAADQATRRAFTASTSSTLLRGHDESTLTHLVASSRPSAHERQSQQSACPRGSVLLAVAAVIQPERTAEPSQAEQVAVRASETAVRGAQEQRRSARNRDRRDARKSPAASGVMAPTPWRGRH